MSKCFIFFTIIVGLSFTSQAQTKSTNTPSELGKQAAELLQKSDFENLHSLFAEKMASTLSPERMKKSFSGLFKQFGELKSIDEFVVKKTAEQDYYQQAVTFEKQQFFLVFTLNKKDLLTSFMLRPYQATYSWSAPSYAAKTGEYIEEDIKIGDSLALNGKLTLPKSGGETIAVFVHGSGPNDMDETLGPNKLFKDIAYGLAANGIASIRYNKRTYDYPSQMARLANEITIQQVVVNDAVKAIELARKKGAKKVILIGHSLGGYCAPMIAELAKPDAVITLAGSVSPLEDLLIGQYEHIRENDTSSNINDFQMAMIKTQVERVQKGEYDSATAPPLLPLGLPASFWLSLKDYEPQKIAKKQTQPYLILNGERDYQVTPSEAKKWKIGSKNKQSKTIIYPHLNHMFFAGEGVCLPSEYEKEGHFSQETLNDIVNWISEL